MTTFSRRSFLRRAGLAAGAAAVAGSAPFVWTRRGARAATTDLHGMAKHLLILLADGGLRSNVLFNGDKALQWNPHLGTDGQPTQAGAPGTDWAVGALFDAAGVPIPSVGASEMAPGLPAVSDAITVLGTVDHEPGADRSDTSHFTARHRIATGFFDGDTGLLTQVYKHHPLYAGSGFETAFPPVVIGQPGQLFALTRSEDGTRRPLFFNGPEDFTTGGSVRPFIAQEGWAAALTSRLDQRFSGRLDARDRASVGDYLSAKQNSARFRDVLRAPMLDITGDGEVDAALGSNALLREALGTAAWGGRMALGLRMLQLGSPAVCVAVTGYDTHSNEVVDLPPLARDLGRQLAGLHYLLNRLEHPDGGTYFDHTLVCVVSEFNRDNTEPGTGYNSANGSDHRGANGSRHQAIPFMGGAIGGGKLIGETDAVTMAPRDRDQVFASQAVLASLLDIVGVDPTDLYREAPLTVMAS